MTSMRLRTAATALALAGALIGSGLIVDQSQAKKGKVKNPLAGRYSGTTEEGLPMSFRVSRSGQVLDFTAQMKLSCPEPTDPTEATLSVGVPIHLTKPVPGYPKGKRFDYGGTSASPPADILSIAGKVATGFRGMEGNVLLRRVHVPSGDLCGTIYASWDARKVR